MRTAKWSRETQGKTQIAGRDRVGVGQKAVAELLGELKGRRRTVPQAAVQANPRNLIFGICKIEEPAANSVAAEIACRSGRRGSGCWGQISTLYERALQAMGVLQ